ncbi:zinc finger protein 17-like [Toxorhynchites rutilus septentrionalis]|uniref:zinc finger protein 17-like n=1 Tax=Toxorhynchites rutilus septentrionalis TaxID=329112 RepID=UPI00247A1BCE|nr:zinc finger protein 17-like [Toxorhynchites rutilus septentrionalis]
MSIMECPSPDQFSQICRLCLGRSELVTIFDWNPRTGRAILSFLVQQTVEMLGLTIEPSDSYPKKICIICKDFLRKLYKFRNQCHEANDLLVERFSRKTEDQLEEQNQPQQQSDQTRTVEFSDPIRRSTTAESSQQAKHVESTPVRETHQEADSSSSNHESPNVKVEVNFPQTTTVDEEELSAEEYEYLEGEVEELEIKHILPQDSSETLTQYECLNTQQEDSETDEQQIGLVIDEDVDPDDCELENSEKEPGPSKPNSSRGQLCKVCGKRSTCMKYHMMCHTGERPFECYFCDKKFRTSTKLNTHVNGVHLKLRNYACEVCDKKFLDAGNLRNHRVTHGGERKFICDYGDCGKSFALPGTLAVHKKSHTQDRQFECEYCSKLFLYKWLLVKHLRIHTGEKPYECNVCNKKFTTITHMHSHKKIHDPNRQKPTRKRKKTGKKSSNEQRQDSDTSDFVGSEN